MSDEQILADPVRRSRRRVRARPHQLWPTSGRQSRRRQHQEQHPVHHQERRQRDTQGITNLADKTKAGKGLETAAAGGISGRFTSAAGSPIADAWVNVFDADEVFYTSALTDSDGRYEAAELPPGQYKIQFDASGNVQWAHQKLDFASADVITVSDGQVTTVDETQAPMGTLAGRLIDSEGQPVTWAAVTARSPDSLSTIFGGTDEDGRYRLDVLPGRYQLRFGLPDGMEQWAHQQLDETDAASFTVTAGETTVVDETLLPTGSINGQVVTSSGEPAAVTVALYRGGLRVASIPASDDGSYWFPQVFEGVYQVAFDRETGGRQWAHGQLAQADAAEFTVTVGQQTVVNETLMATGAIAGRLTRATGEPAADAQVLLQHGEEFQLETQTDASGEYRIEGVPATDGYVVSFNDFQTGLHQYAFGKLTAAEADRISVVGGQTTTVTDTLLPGGELRVRATDGTTGGPISDFCVSLSGPSSRTECTSGAEVIVTNLPGGAYEGSVQPGESSLYLFGDFAVTVSSGGAAEVVVPLTLGGAITTVVTDAATGRPVADTCLMARTLDDGALGEAGGQCTDFAGRVRVGPMAAGTYTLFALAPFEASYGHQWVGSAKGTGSQPEAAKIKVERGQTVAGPAVRLDSAGTVTGLVTLAATGEPVDSGFVAYSAWGFGAGPSHGVDIDGEGRYRLTGLGPYQWPLYFTTHNGAAPQWSGGVGNRFKADRIQVTAGGSTTYDAAMAPGTLVRGAARPASGPLEFARLTAFNVVTGDPIAVADAGPDGTYTTRVIGPQIVKIGYDWTPDGETYRSGWYDGATSYAEADPVRVPARGPKVFNVALR